MYAYCKSVYTGSIPVLASISFRTLRRISLSLQIRIVQSRSAGVLYSSCPELQNLVGFARPTTAYTLTILYARSRSSPKMLASWDAYRLVHTMPSPLISISPWQFDIAAIDWPVLTVIGVWTQPIVEWLVSGVNFKEIIGVSKNFPVIANS